MSLALRTSTEEIAHIRTLRKYDVIYTSNKWYYTFVMLQFVENLIALDRCIGKPYYSNSTLAVKYDLDEYLLPTVANFRELYPVNSLNTDATGILLFAT